MATPTRSQPSEHLGEMIAALSMATDLANGHALETALRTALLSHSIAETMGLSAQERSTCYYGGLLRYLGCTAYAHEEAATFGGDDIELRRLYNRVDTDSMSARLAATFSGLAVDAPVRTRATSIARALRHGDSFKIKQEAASCEASLHLAVGLGLDQEVQRVLVHAFERFDGKGTQNIPEAALSLPTRIVHVATMSVLLHQQGGASLALARARKRSGSLFDPHVVTALEDGSSVFAALNEPSVWPLAMALAPAKAPFNTTADAVCAAFANFSDLKSVYTLGFSSSVAQTSESAARQMRLGPEIETDLRYAGLLHSLGRVSVPNGVWEKRTALNQAEVDRVRLYPHYTERVLDKSASLRGIAKLSGGCQERLDGSGYHRGRSEPSMPMSILAASVVHHALVSERPYRPAMTPKEASVIMQAEVDAGRLHYDAVAAVSEVVGQRAPKPPPYPVDLSQREVEVLQLVAKALSNKEIAQKLFISAKTVQHHVAHIYEKADVDTRVGAALFAIENNLLSR